MAGYRPKPTSGPIRHPPSFGTPGAGGMARELARALVELAKAGRRVRELERELRRSEWQNARAFWVHPDGGYTTLPPEPPEEYVNGEPGAMRTLPDRRDEGVEPGDEA